MSVNFAFAVGLYIRPSREKFTMIYYISVYEFGILYQIPVNVSANLSKFPIIDLGI